MKNRITKSQIFILIGIVTIGLWGKYYKRSRKQKNKDKISFYYDILNKWMKLKENNVSIAERLKEKGIETIAIYGMGDIGKHLEKELENSDILVKYAIDRSYYAIIDLDVYDPESEMPPVDAIIVTPVFEFEDICRSMKERMNCKIWSIADIVSDKWEE